ncbi:MAG TPA: hypothetical protein VLA04_04685, partial [Verrucomicrobiae bacterium]|nr:hypothetical protein [Verrucomicrobiae bacterium]
ELKATKNVSPDPRALPDTNLESLLAEFPLPATPSRAMAQEVRTEKPRVLKEKKPRSFKGVKRLALRTAVLALMATAGWTGVQALQDKEAGQVAGVTTATTPIPDATLTENPANKYKESFATVPFAQTEWENFADPDLGFTVRYPKNATNIVRTSTNAWFLRYDGYFLKVTVETTNDQLDGWWAKSKGFYEEGNTISKGTFKSRPAYIIRPTEPTKSSGTTYFVASKTGVTHIFVRDELDPETDDAKRITSMVNSLTLTN